MAARRRWKDRTAAFEAGVLARSTRPPPAVPGPTQFLRIAGAIARDLQDTSAKLAELTRLTRKAEVLYAREIAELSGIVKTDIRNLKSQLEELRRVSAAKGQSGQHHELVVTSLQTRLAERTKDFRSILAERTAKLERSAAVEAALSGSMGAALAASNTPLLLSSPPALSTSTATTSMAARAGGASPPLLSSSHSPAALSSSSSTSSPAHDPAAGAFLTNDLMAPLEALSTQAVQQAYSAQRLQAVENINETMQELHTIFIDLRSLIATQAELADRIERNVVETEENLISTQQQIVEYWRRMSSNRWFVIKLLAILAFFVRAHMDDRNISLKKKLIPIPLRRSCSSSSLHRLDGWCVACVCVCLISSFCASHSNVLINKLIFWNSTLIDGRGAGEFAVTGGGVEHLDEVHKVLLVPEGTHPLAMVLRAVVALEMLSIEEEHN